MGGHPSQARSGERTPIRVLWLIKGLGPGGAEQLLASAAKVADHNRFHYEVGFLRPDKQHLVPALEAVGVRTHCLTTRSSDRFLWPLSLRRLMREADLVHAHSPLMAGVARLVARTLPRRPFTVSTEHNVWGSFATPTRLLNALTAALDAQRWSVSDTVRRSMWGPLGTGAPVLIHGIVLGSHATKPGTRERIRAELGLPADAVVAVTVANFRREKDYPNLLRAARRAFDQDPRLHIVAVGQGPLEAEVRALHAELSLGDRFVLTGYRADVSDILAASDLFTLGSAFEGLPVSIMEAMAAGLPVVATAVGGVPEAVTEGVTGLLVPPHEDEALARALLELSRDPERRAHMGEQARDRSTGFDIRTAVAVQQDAYVRIAGQRRRTPLASPTTRA